MMGERDRSAFGKAASVASMVKTDRDRLAAAFEPYLEAVVTEGTQPSGDEYFDKEIAGIKNLVVKIKRTSPV